MTSRFALAVACMALAACQSEAPHADAEISPDRLAAHINVLSSDEFEERSPTTEGEKKTVDYLSSQRAALGAARDATASATR